MTWDELKVINEGKLHKDQDDWRVVLDGEDMGWLIGSYKHFAEITVRLDNLVEGTDKATQVELSDIEYCGNKEDYDAQLAALL